MSEKATKPDYIVIPEESLRDGRSPFELYDLDKVYQRLAISL